MTSEKCIEIIKDRLIALVDSGKLNATYRPSDSTISFYVKDISIGKRPLLTLRLSDHRPNYQNYIGQQNTPPSSGYNTNISIEFYKPKYKASGKTYRDRIDANVSVPNGIRGVIPFVVKSFKYKPELLAESDIDQIYQAIIDWIYGGDEAEYVDPFIGSPKEAKVASKEAKIKWNISQNISVDKDGNYISANSDGADYVSEITKHTNAL